jgi:predicted GNAT family acetyltransferase
VGTTTAEERHPLDNAVWWALGSRHQEHSRTRGRARAYRSDVSVFAAVDTFDPASWSDLAALLGPSRHAALFRSEVPSDLPAGWVVGGRIPCVQMLVGAETLRPVVPVPVRRLTPDDVPLMLDLVARTEPGPFRSRTIAMGDYYGHFEGANLVSMAGERLGFEGYTEISAVCTDPAAQGRGLGSALTHHVASEILARGEQPFLHVAETNAGARRVYESLGFVQRRWVDAVLVQAPAD